MRDWRKKGQSYMPNSTRFWRCVSKTRTCNTSGSEKALHVFLWSHTWMIVQAKQRGNNEDLPVGVKWAQLKQNFDFAHRLHPNWCYFILFGTSHLWSHPLSAWCCLICLKFSDELKDAIRQGCPTNFSSGATCGTIWSQVGHTICFSTNTLWKCLHIMNHSFTEHYE